MPTEAPKILSKFKGNLQSMAFPLNFIIILTMVAKKRHGLAIPRGFRMLQMAGASGVKSSPEI